MAPDRQLVQRCGFRFFRPERSLGQQRGEKRHQVVRRGAGRDLGNDFGQLQGFADGGIRTEPGEKGGQRSDVAGGIDGGLTGGGFAVDQNFDFFQTAAVAGGTGVGWPGCLGRSFGTPPGIEFIGRFTRGGRKLGHGFHLIFRYRAESLLFDGGAECGRIHAGRFDRVDDAAGFQTGPEQRGFFQDAFEGDRHGTAAAVAGGDGNGAAFAVRCPGGAPAGTAENIAAGLEGQQFAETADDLVGRQGIIAEAQGANHGHPVEVGGQSGADGGDQDFAENGGIGKTERGGFDDKSALFGFQFDLVVLVIPGGPDDFQFFGGFRGDAAFGVFEGGNNGFKVSGGGMFCHLDDKIVELILIHDERFSVSAS